MPTQRPRISFVADDELRTDLGLWADQDNRTVSNLIETILSIAVKKKADQENKIRSDANIAIATLRDQLTTEQQEQLKIIERGLNRDQE